MGFAPIASAHHSRLTMLRVICLVFIFLFNFVGISQSEPSDGPAPVLSLTGYHKFQAGDDPQWSDPLYDDAHWQSIKVPASWRSQRIRPENGMGWYRIYFSIPKRLKDKDLGVLLGFIGDADETFLNGIRIGGEGVIGRWFVEAKRIERLYKLPQALLKPGNGNNLLAIRVMHIYREGGLIKGDVSIGPYLELLEAKLQRDFFRDFSDVLAASGLFLFVLACLFFYIAGIRENEYIYFGLFAFVSFLTFLLDAPFVYGLGLKSSLVQSVITALIGLIPVSFLLFLISAFRFEYRLFFKSIIIFSTTLAMVLFLFGTYRLSVYRFLSILWNIEVFLICVVSIYMAGLSYQRKYNESGPILLGCLGLLAVAALETLHAIEYVQIGGPDAPTYPFIFFLICMLYALVKRFVRFRNQTLIFSRRILSAQEEERKRLARELHDGLGQNLLTLKFNLQRNNQNPDRELMAGAIRDVSESIDELRLISRGLRPAFLDEMGLVAAMKYFSRSFSEKSGLKVVLDIDDMVRCDALIEENLFRIYQEALSNAAKHGDATQVSVSVNQNGKRIRMTIADDGSGFDSQRIDPVRHGIGLSTMQERVALLDGRFSIRNGKDRGAEIRVEVPLK